MGSLMKFKVHFLGNFTELEEVREGFLEEMVL
jgi:hypothetical protein